jgi:hypothetical protein
MENLMEFEVVAKNGSRSKRSVSVKKLYLAISRAPPKTCRKSRYLLTNEDVIEVEEQRTLGEVEYVSVVDDGELFITAGSDHLDLTVTGMTFENAGRVVDPAKAKQLCPAVVARELWPYEDVKDHWDALRLKSSVTISGERVQFQDYPMSQLVNLDSHFRANPSLRENGTVLFSGSSDTLPSAPPNLYNITVGKEGIFPRDFHFEMHDPVLGRTISHGYNIQVLV